MQNTLVPLQHAATQQQAWKGVSSSYNNKSSCGINLPHSKVVIAAGGYEKVLYYKAVITWKEEQEVETTTATTDSKSDPVRQKNDKELVRDHAHFSLSLSIPCIFSLILVHTLRLLCIIITTLLGISCCLFQPWFYHYINWNTIITYWQVHMREREREGEGEKKRAELD